MASGSHLNILDTRQMDDTIEFCDSSPQDSALARHFWMSVQLQPHIESRLVSSDIKQRLKISRGGTEAEVRVSQFSDTDSKYQMMEDLKKETKLAKFHERKKILQDQLSARKWKRLALEEKSGQNMFTSDWWKYEKIVRSQDQETKDIVNEVKNEIAKFEERKFKA